MSNTNSQSKNYLQKIRDFTNTPQYIEYHTQEKLALMLATRVKQIREAKQWTQQDLADRMKVTQSVVARLEAGKAGTSLKTVGKFIDAINGKLEIIY